MREHLILGLLPILFLVVLVSSAVANDEVAREAFNGYVKEFSSPGPAVASADKNTAVAETTVTYRLASGGGNRYGQAFNSTPGANCPNGSGGERTMARDGSGNNANGQSGQYGGNGDMDRDRVRQQNRDGSGNQGGYGDTDRIRQQNRDGSCGTGSHNQGNGNRNRQNSGNGYNNGSGNGNRNGSGNGYGNRSGSGNHYGWNNDVAPGYWEQNCYGNGSGQGNRNRGNGGNGSGNGNRHGNGGGNGHHGGGGYGRNR